MKDKIHPQYYDSAKVHCACGNVFSVGSTKLEIETDICSSCHPFYTGKEKLLDIAGRIEKFKARKVKAEVTKKASKVRKSK